MAGYDLGCYVLGAAKHRWKQTTLDTSKLKLNKELFMPATPRQTIVPVLTLLCTLLLIVKANASGLRERCRSGALSSGFVSKVLSPGTLSSSNSVSFPYENRYEGAPPHRLWFCWFLIFPQEKVVLPVLSIGKATR